MSGDPPELRARRPASSGPRELTLYIQRVLGVSVRQAIRAEFGFDPASPLVVCVRFVIEGGSPVVWRIGRDLLRQGLHSMSGLGDVTIWPADLAEGATARLRLASGDMAALFELPVAPLARWLEHTYELVPAGHELASVDWETTTTELLGGPAARLDLRGPVTGRQTTDPAGTCGFDNECAGDHPERNRTPMTFIKSPLPDKEREIAGDALQATLVDLLDLSLVAKQVHWNLYGPRFRSIHLQLDEVVTAARDYADLVAERAAALGVSPDGRAATIAATSGLPGFPAGWTKDTAAVDALVRTFSAVVERVRARIEETGPADAVTQDLLIGLTADLEKQSWMFQAENRD
jgi:starvation-inducible DNA-binding protein